MRRFAFLAVLLMMVGGARALDAQSEHAAPQAALDTALDRHVTTIAADRDAIRRVLSRPDVKATSSGLVLTGEAGLKPFRPFRETI